MDNKIPVIIDCDPGHDDAIALIMAFASEKLDVLGVSVSAGNQTIEYADDNLNFTFDYIFSYENGTEQTHKAQVVFETCDIDFFEILVFNNTILDTFTGKRIELPQYQQDYSESEFEVITETYNWGHAVFQGWLWTEGNPVHCIMNIYFKGDMVYVVE